MVARESIDALTENIEIQTSTTTPLLNTKSGGLRFNEIGGVSIQNGTPTPDSPIGIESAVVSEIKSTPNLVKYLESGGIDSSTGEETSSSTLWRTHYIEVVPNRNLYVYGYDISSTRNARMFYYDKDKNYISTELGTNHFSITTPSNCYYVRVHLAQSITNYMDIVVSYLPKEEYKETSATITLSEPLKESDVMTRTGVNRKRIRKTYDGSETAWQSYSSNVSGLFGIKRADAKVNQLVLCTHYKKSSAPNSYNNLCCGIDQYGNFWIVDTQFNDSVEELRAWLTENPMTIEYEPTTPTFEELSTADQIALTSLETFDGVTNIVFDSTVEPTFEVEYGMSSASAYALKALNDSEINALGGKATNSKELTNGELYSNIIRGYKYGRTVVLSFHNVKPLALTTYLMNNSGFLDNAHDIYANVRLLIYGTYAGIGILSCSANEIGTSENTDYLYTIQYYPSTSTSSTVMSDDETAYISGTIAYVATNYDIE